MEYVLPFIINLILLCLFTILLAALSIDEVKEEKQKRETKFKGSSKAA